MLLEATMRIKIFVLSIFEWPFNNVTTSSLLLRQVIWNLCSSYWFASVLSSITAIIESVIIPNRGHTHILLETSYSNIRYYISAHALLNLLKELGKRPNQRPAERFNH